jgi:hypothetical protein
LSVDPLAGEYAPLTPYAFAGNMPIWAKDPDGKRIEIVGSAEYRQQVYEALALIARKSKTGRELLTRIINSDDVLVISADQAKAIGVYQPQAQPDGTKSVSFIYNPIEATETLDASNGAQGQPLSQNSMTVVGHELQHVDDVFEGNIQPFVFNPDQPYINSGEISDNNQPIWNPNGIKGGEVGAVLTENKIRSELGLTLRTHYGGFKVFGMGISKSKVKFQNGPGGSGHILFGLKNNVDFSSFFDQNVDLGPHLTLSGMLNIKESETSEIKTRGFTKPKSYGSQQGTTILKKNK